jgi:hypothetical protein
MIWESWYWKQPLLEMAERLRGLRSVQALSEEQLVQIEKDLFSGFYAVRKLFETVTKVTDVTKAKKVKITWHPNKKPVSWTNNHHVDEIYALDQRHSETRDLWFVSGRIIHSFIFSPVVEDDTGCLVGIFFTSDTDKDKKLYFMDIDTVIHVFELVGHDDPTTIKWKRNPETGEETTQVI